MALIEFFEPLITARVNGATPSAPLNTSRRPDGVDVNVRATVCGFRRTLSVSANPPESVAVNTSSRWAGYSWSGATNEPMATPRNVSSGCV